MIARFSGMTLCIPEGWVGKASFATAVVQVGFLNSTIDYLVHAECWRTTL